ncbi:hypothetical protein ACLB2K_069462 [Fragaria x ananassa]
MNLVCMQLMDLCMFQLAWPSGFFCFGKKDASLAPQVELADLVRTCDSTFLNTDTGEERMLVHWLSLISSPSFYNSHAKNRPLYICAVEEYGDCVLREVALLDGGDDIPYAMGFCVFRSQITLPGGCFLSPDPKIYFAPKPLYVLDTTASEPRFVISSKIPSMKRDRMPLPWLREIEGKLYALSAENFSVLDLITKKWCRLKSLPFPCEHFSFSVVGSMIFATHTRSCITYCFDVKCSFKWTEIGDLFRFEGACNYHNNTLVLDTEDDSEKLMFIFGYSQILVHRILQHPGSVSCEFELVASIDLPEFPCLSECDDDLSSYSSAHLGDRKVCFSFLYWNVAQVRSLLVLPLEFTYSKSGADFSSTSDQSSLRCTCVRGSFVAKALGYHMFKYDYIDDESYFKTSHLDWGVCCLFQSKDKKGRLC